MTKEQMKAGVAELNYMYSWKKWWVKDGRLFATVGPSLNTKSPIRTVKWTGKDWV